VAEVHGPGAAGGAEREYVGFVWSDADDEPRRDFKVMAASLAEAKAWALEKFGAALRVSVWNEEDAARLR